MSKELSAKYCQINKERLQKKACERYQSLPKQEKKTKNINSLTLQKSLRR